MEYKNKYNGTIYNTEQELFDFVKSQNIKRPKVEKVYPKIKDNPTPLLEIPENSTEEEIENIINQNEQITLNNIEYMVKEFE